MNYSGFNKFFLFIASIFLAFTLCCSSAEEQAAPEDEDNDGTTDTDTDTTYTFPVTTQQNYVGWAISAVLWDLHNTYLAGRPTGAHNETWYGTVDTTQTITATGTTSYSSSTLLGTMDMNFTTTGFTIIKISGNVTITLTFSGTLRKTGSWSSTTSYKSMQLTSSNLTISGTIKASGYEDAVINKTGCSFSVTDTHPESADSKGTMVTTINGEATSFTYNISQSVE